MYRRITVPTWAFSILVSMSLAPAVAQDLNVQTELEILAPAPEISTPTPQRETILVPQYEPVFEPVRVKKQTPELLNELYSLPTDDKERFVNTLTSPAVNDSVTYQLLEDGKPVDPTTMGLRPPDFGALEIKNLSFSGPKGTKQEQDFFANLLVEATGNKNAPFTTILRATGEKRLVGEKQKTITKPAKTTVVATLSSSYNSDSNVFSTPDNIVADGYMKVVPKVKVTIPTSSKSNLGLALSSTYARYDEETSKDQDILLGEIAYARELSAVRLNPDSGTVQKEAVGLKLVSRASYDPGYSGPGTRLYQPVLSWQLSNIPLGSDLCGKSKKVNCYTATLSAEVSRTWFGSLGAQKNWGFKAGGTFNWNVRAPDLTLAVFGSVTNTLYDDFPGGRDDVFFVAGSVLTWKPDGTKLALSAGANYYNNLSTVDAAEYSKYLLVPQVVATLNF